MIFTYFQNFLLFHKKIIYLKLINKSINTFIYVFFSLIYKSFFFGSFSFFKKFKKIYLEFTEVKFY